MSAGIKLSEEFVKKFGKKFPPESFLAREGEPGNTMYLIANGKVAVIKQTPVGEKILATLAEGDFFGEMAILGAQDRRGASVKTLVETMVLELTREAFEGLIRRSPEIAMKVISTLVDRVRDGNAKTAALIHKDDFVRISAYLQFLSADRGIVPSHGSSVQTPGKAFVLKQDHACSSLGISKETLLIYLTYAHKARLVAQNGEWLWVPYPQYLPPFGDFLSKNTKH